jgi:hypothetical protein
MAECGIVARAGTTGGLPRADALQTSEERRQSLIDDLAGWLMMDGRHRSG